jgi:hypothetical protein
MTDDRLARLVLNAHKLLKSAKEAYPRATGERLEGVCMAAIEIALIENGDGTQDVE